MSEIRKIAAILADDVVGYSRLAGADEDRTLSWPRGLRSDLIDPALAAHRGRIFKRSGDGALSSSAAWSTPCTITSTVFSAHYWLAARHGSQEWA